MEKVKEEDRDGGNWSQATEGYEQGQYYQETQETEKVKCGGAGGEGMEGYNTKHQTAK